MSEHKCDPLIKHIYTTCKNVSHTQTRYKVTYTFGKPAKRVQAPLSIRNPLQWCRINPDLSTTARTHIRTRWPFGLRLRVPGLTGGFQRFKEHTLP